MSYLPPITDQELEWYTTSEKRCSRLFIKNRWISRTYACEKCAATCQAERNSKDWHDHKYMDPYHYQCPDYASHTFSIRSDTMFDNSPLLLSDHLKILYKYYYGVPVERAAKQTKLSRVTIIKYYQIYRKCLGSAVTAYYADAGNKLGREMVIEIDESKFNKKRKNYRGNDTGPDMWVFGLVERNSGRCYLITVPDRSAETLIPIIRRIAGDASTVISDQWRAYLSLGDEGYVHVTVNHSVQFVDPLTGEHTNTIEGLWSNAKDKFKAMHGSLREYAQSYLDEFMFRRLFSRSNNGLMQEMMISIARYYNH
eukprot:4354_1